jgi:anti-sigma regulatory factor (Ser/Thr protein kinase)
MTAGAKTSPDPRSAPAVPLATHLVVRNRIAELETARAALGGLLRTADASPQGVYDAELVLEELFTNVVRHGFPHGDDEAAHTIALAFEVRGDTLLLTIEDDGVAFDPRNAPAPARPESLADARPGGLGLVLVRSVVRRLDYARENGRNRTAAVLSLHPATAAEIVAPAPVEPPAREARPNAA